MVGVFVRLKLRVLRNSTTGRQATALILGGIAGMALAVPNLFIGLTRFDSLDTIVDLLAVAYAVWLAGWVVAPVATGGGNETLRAEHFVLLPMSRTQLATGLLAASFVAVPALVGLVAFAGMVAFGLRLGPGATLVGLLSMTLQLLLVILVYRVAMTGLGSLLNSRAGKELGLVLVALTGMAGVVVHYAFSTVGPALIEGRAAGFVAVARALPSGWGPQAVQAAGTGNWGRAVLLLGGMLACVAALLAAWAWLLSRSLTHGPFRGAGRSHRDTMAVRRRSLLPATPVGAVTAKELRTWWRDMRRRLALFSSMIMAAMFALLPSLSAAGPSRTAPYLALYLLAAACVQTGNMYGFDGSSLWHTVVTPGAARADVRGRQLAWTLLVGPPALVLAAVLPGVTGHQAAYPWVLSLLPALLGTGAGAVVLQAVYAAYPLPDQRHSSNPFVSGGRPGCARLLLVLALLGLLVVAAVPVVGVVLAGTLLETAVLSWIGIPLGIVVGVTFSWWCGRVATLRLNDHGPELLQTVSEEA